MWLPLLLLGVKPFRAALDEKILLARYFHREIAAAGFEVGPSPDLSIVTFRWARLRERMRRAECRCIPTPSTQVRVGLTTGSPRPAPLREW